MNDAEGSRSTGVELRAGAGIGAIGRGDDMMSSGSVSRRSRVGTSSLDIWDCCAGSSTGLCDANERCVDTEQAGACFRFNFHP